MVIFCVDSRSDTVYGPVSETVKICLGKVLKKSLFLSQTKEGEPWLLIRLLYFV